MKPKTNPTFAVDLSMNRIILEVGYQYTALTLFPFQNRYETNGIMCRNTFWVIQIFVNCSTWKILLYRRPLAIFMKWFILAVHQALNSIFNLPFMLRATHSFLIHPGHSRLFIYFSPIINQWNEMMKNKQQWNTRALPKIFWKTPLHMQWGSGVWVH